MHNDRVVYCIVVGLGMVAAGERARQAASLLDGLSDVSTVDDDEPLWERQRQGQRSSQGAVVKVSGRPADLPNVLAAADAAGASLTSRAGLGLSYLTLSEELPGGLPSRDLDTRLDRLRAAVAPRACVVLDGAARVPEPGPRWRPGWPR